MGSKGFISLGEAYEILVQVTASEQVNNSNTMTMLHEIIRQVMQMHSHWNLKVKTDYSEFTTNCEKEVS